MSKFKVVLLGLLVACAASAFAASSASALRWFICLKVGPNSKFHDSLCAEQTGGEWELKELQGLLLIHQRLVPGTNATLKGEVLATSTEIACTEVEGVGASILNPVSPTANGDDSGTTLFLGCTVKKPALGCKIKEGFINTPALSHLLTILGDNWDVFTPLTGSTTFSTFAFEGCSLGTFNKPYKVEGEAAGLWDNATSTILFGTNHTQELLQNLTFGGNPGATFKAEVLVLTHTGGGVQVL